MDRQKLRTAALCAFIGVGLSFPMALLNFSTLGDRSSLALRYALFILVAFIFASKVYVLTTFRELLNRLCHFHAVDDLISYQIVLAGAIITLAAIARLLPVLKIPMGVLLIGLAIVAGIVEILIANRLGLLGHPLFGLRGRLTMFYYINGICDVTVVLTLIEFITGPIQMVVFGLLLLRAADVIGNESLRYPDEPSRY